MSTYSIEKLMAQTRQLAANYYESTQQSLPLSSELAKYDAMRLLGLKPVEELISGVDALTDTHQKIQIKSRVIFNAGNHTYRVGQLNLEAVWDQVVLVLYDKRYEPYEIYGLAKQAIESAADKAANQPRSKRGMMSVAKFKAIGELVWTAPDGQRDS